MSEKKRKAEEALALLARDGDGSEHEEVQARVQEDLAEAAVEQMVLVRRGRRDWKRSRKAL